MSAGPGGAWEGDPPDPAAEIARAVSKLADAMPQLRGSVVIRVSIGNEMVGPGGGAVSWSQQLVGFTDLDCWQLLASVRGFVLTRRAVQAAADAGKPAADDRADG